MIRTDTTITFKRDEVIILPSECEWVEVTTFEDDAKGQRVYVKAKPKCQPEQ